MSSFIVGLCLSILLIHSSTSNEIENRVYGGREFHPYEHRYLVSLSIHYLKSGGLLCSGSILSSEWIISAAHCFPEYFLDPITHVEAHQKWTDDLQLIAIAFASDIRIHPNYVKVALDTLSKTDFSERDLALVKTAIPMVFGIFTWPIALPKHFVKIGALATIAGYGDAEVGVAKPREGSVFINECFDEEKHLLCTYNVAGPGRGDSGGPLVSEGVLVGVYSAKVLGNVLGYAYADVYYNIEWIKGVMASPSH